MVEKEEVEGWEDLKRPELIEALKKEFEEKEEKPEKVKKPEAKKEVEESKKEPEIEKEPEEGLGEGIGESHIPLGGKAEAMKAKLAKQPKITILIPLEKNEKPGSTMSVILNDYRLNIQKGTYVPVPQQVARIIMKSQKQTVAAINEGLNLDNPNHPKRKSGEGVRDLDA